MTRNRIRKGDLTAYIDVLCAERRKELEDEVNREYDRRITPFVIAMFDNTEMVQSLNQLSKKINEYIEKWGTKFTEEWSIKQILRYDSSVRTAHSAARNNLNTYIGSRLKDVNVIKTGNIELDKAIESMRQWVKPYYEKINNIAILQTQLTNIIVNAKDGNQAYKAIVAAGVDLTDFEPAKKNLPAVVKLSVDPCLLNGTCK